MSCTAVNMCVLVKKCPLAVATTQAPFVAGDDEVMSTLNSILSNSPHVPSGRINFMAIIHSSDNVMHA